MDNREEEVMISMCACGSIYCPHCNPNLWTNPSAARAEADLQTILSLRDEIRQLRMELEGYKQLSEVQSFLLKGRKSSVEE